MTRDELTKAFRIDVQDTVKPYLFDDSTVHGWLAEAEAEAAIRGRLLHESSNALVCEIDAEAGTSVYPLHPALYEISSIGFRLAGAPRREPVKLASAEYLDDRVRDWRDLDGTPTYAIQSETSIRLVPRPLAAGTLLMECYRLPLKSLAENGTAKPEIHVAHHRHLVDWALFRAYGLPDSETMNLGSADAAERRFTNYFGVRPDSNLRRITREDGPHHNQAHFL